MIDTKKIVSDALDTAETSAKADRANVAVLRDKLVKELNELSDQIALLNVKLDSFDADLSAIAAARK